MNAYECATSTTTSTSTTPAPSFAWSASKRSTRLFNSQVLPKSPNWHHFHRPTRWLMRLRLLLSRTDSCCMLVNAFLMLEFYATKASGALCPRHSKTICHVFQYIFSKPVVTWRMMWVFSRTDIKHIQQFPCLRVASRQKWRASLKTLLKSEKHVYRAKCLAMDQEFQ